MELQDKTILITGGARVGQVVAQELLDAGAKIAMTFLKDESEAHPKAVAYQVDVTNEESVRKLWKDVQEKSGPVDGLINMASIFKPDSEAITFIEFQKLFAVNAFGNMLLSRLFAEETKKADKKNMPIISFIDWAIDHPYRNYDVYLASKAALRHYLMALQSSFAGFIRVVNVHPGMILEPPNFPTAQKESIMKNTPTQGIGSPEQAAQLVRTALELDFLADNINLAGGQQWRHRL